MTARAQAAFVKYPTFLSLPMLGEPGKLKEYQIELPSFVSMLPKEVDFPVDEQLYVASLYGASVLGVPAGRGAGAKKYTIFVGKVQ